MGGRANTSRTVVFVGAGASRACGYPVTSEILPEILRQLDQKKFGDEHIDAHAPRLRKFLKKLLPHRGSKALPQITDLLSVIDHCLESGEELFSATDRTLPLAEAHWLLERAMARVIKRIHKRDTKPREILHCINRQRKKGADVTIISTNYDFSLDEVLLDDLDNWDKDYKRTDFGFTWRAPDDGELVHPSSRPKLRLYKVHGALNWLGCGRCGNIYINFERTLVSLADGHGDWSCCHCGFEPLRAVLVAPSFVRRYRERNLLSVWRSATEALRLADLWTFMGYSFPAEDVAIRALLLRALFARKKPPSVEVVNRGKEAFSRYRQLFPKCRYTDDGVGAFVNGTSEWIRD